MLLLLLDRPLELLAGDLPGDVSLAVPGCAGESLLSCAGRSEAELAHTVDSVE